MVQLETATKKKKAKNNVCLPTSISLCWPLAIPLSTAQSTPTSVSSSTQSLWYHVTEIDYIRELCIRSVTTVSCVLLKLINHNCNLPVYLVPQTCLEYACESTGYGCMSLCLVSVSKHCKPECGRQWRVTETAGNDWVLTGGKRIAENSGDVWGLDQSVNGSIVCGCHYTGRVSSNGGELPPKASPPDRCRSNL